MLECIKLTFSEIFIANKAKPWSPHVIVLYFCIKEIVISNTIYAIFTHVFSSIPPHNRSNSASFEYFCMEISVGYKEYHSGYLYNEK